MKLNTKRTLLIGLAFLSICSFWQLYDNVIPLILRDTFHVPDTWAGVIMALDNILALFMLPLFGKLSDATSTKIGKRMPYIIGGTALAVILMNLLPAAVAVVSLPAFITVLGLLLISMGVYRSPAVALMPDVTPKPLRSKGNAIINLMGALGGVVTLALNKFLVLYSVYDASGNLLGENVRNESALLKQLGLAKADVITVSNYRWLFVAISVLMLVSVVLLLITIRENKLREETEQINNRLDAENPNEAERAAALNAGKGFKSLPAELQRSLVLILASVFLWFMGYNAVTSAFTKYVSVQWNYNLSAASNFLLVASAGAIVSYLPVGVLSSKFGRKRVIQAGVAVLAACFAVTAFFHEFHFAAYIIFALIGSAWAMINVNSYPMVVEISKNSDIGKFTGYYYTFSMAAQIATPIISGWLLEHVGYHTLLPYAAIMVLCSLVTISLTKHGDSRPDLPQDKLEAFQMGDD